MDATDLWAREGGLIGLVLLSLFSLIGIFIHTISKKDKQHQDFIKEIIADERRERKDVRGDYIRVNSRLTAAIDSLTAEIKNRE